MRKVHLREKESPPEQLERAISIRQPYAERILAGTKTREFRSRPTRIRGRVYLYAGLKMAEGTRVTSKVAALPKGFIVGSVDITDCRDLTDCYAYVLKRPRRYRTPIAARGQPQPGFWRPRFA